MRLRQADSSGGQSGRGAGSGGAASTSSTGSSARSGGGGDGVRSAPTITLGASSRTYVPVRTLPLIFAQRKRHLQQQKSRALHAAPYQVRGGEGLLSLPEDVLVSACMPPHPH